MKGITLIGMPGVGKSTIGRQLAERLGWRFIDLDLVLEEKTGQKPADFIKEKGEPKFLNLEEKSALELDLADAVLAPGGSIIYCSEAMEKLKKETKIFYLNLPLEKIKERLGSRVEQRGIIGLAKSGLEELFNQRDFLYRNYAQQIIFCSDCDDGQIIEQIKKLA